MSGGTLAYHLRPNKAADRALFMELLAKVDGALNLRRYTYVGMGGPFLEDFRQIHGHVGIRRMVSFESSPEVYKRQRFNRPLSCIKCVNSTSAEFIEHFPFDTPTVIWLDYTDGERRSQLAEMQTVLAKLRAGDILKITMNGSAATLSSGRVWDKDDGREINLDRELLLERRFQKLKESLGDFVPEDAAVNQMDDDGLSVILCKSIVRAAAQALAGHEAAFIPLTAFQYADGQNMITVAGVLLKPSETKKFLRNTSLEKWWFRTDDDAIPKKIKLPALSARERMFVDRLLPRHKESAIRQRLHFLVGTEAEWLLSLKSYREFYRHYPLFSRVFI